MAGQPGALAPLEPGPTETGLDRHPDLVQLEGLIERTREMARSVDNLWDATVLVRRAGATEKLVGEALRSCQLLEEQQFTLRQAATEAHLRTQRRAGELLMSLQKHRGGRRPTDDIVQAVESRPVTLRELGIRTHESHRWQRIASLPADAFEEIISTTRERRRELTTASMLAEARRRARDSQSEHEPESVGADQPGSLPCERVLRHMRELVAVEPTWIAGALHRRERCSELVQLRAWLDSVEGLLMGGDRSGVASS